MNEQNKQIEIIRSGRKTLSIEIKQDLRIIVRAPSRMKSADIEKFIEEKTAWIEKHLNILRRRKEKTADKEPIKPFTCEEIEELAQRALTVIVPKVEAYATMIGVTYGKITVRNQVSRWGSCTAKGNLNFNCLLMLCPSYVLDYVIIHELCHRRHMNHSEAFWKTVELYCPEYKSAKAWLRENGGELIEKIRLMSS